MKKMRLLVLSTLVLSGVNAQTNLDLETWSDPTTATGWQNLLTGIEALVPGEEPAVNQDSGNGGGFSARLNPIDLSSLQPGAPVGSIFILGDSGQGAPYTTRVESVDFDAKLMLTGDAVAAVEIYITNGTDTLGTGTGNYTTNIASFTTENIVITYDPAFNGINPDNISITVIAIGTTPASTDTDFWVDNFVIHDVNSASVNELDKNAWKLAASNGNIIVSGVDNGEVAVYNAAGQVVATGTVENGQAVINASNLASGITMVTLTSGTQVGTKKIIL